MFLPGYKTENDINAVSVFSPVNHHLVVNQRVITVYTAVPIIAGGAGQGVVNSETDLVSCHIEFFNLFKLQHSERNIGI